MKISLLILMPDSSIEPGAIPVNNFQMTSTLYCNNYDEQLQQALPHLAAYPQLLPFIGHAWPQQQSKILLAAESHYLPKTFRGINNSQTWYNNDCNCLTNWQKQCITTRRVVTKADNYLVTNEPFNGSFQIFYNIKNAVFDSLGIKSKNKNIFQHLAFYNYFQRPAEITGDSINNTEVDDQVAYETLKAICNITQPTAIIFTSQKAYKSFKSQHIEKNAITDSIRIQNVAHPASPWWNMESKKPSVTGIAETGRAKFIRSLKLYNIHLIAPDIV